VSRDVCKPPGGPDVAPPARSPAERSADFQESIAGYDADAARAAAARCLATLTCTYCDVCQLMCPDQCITRDPATGDILFDLNHCKGCGLCAHYCPKGAIQMQIEKKGDGA
jgi:Pyruvate/2-oxoacid:ferredoxin oxidoreductase delta subunit